MRITKAFLSLTFSLACLGLAGCPASGVGDPCRPESTPEGGFIASEAYLETSSVQCRTRVCLVYQLNGDPTRSFEDCTEAGESPEACRVHPTETVLDQSVFCTCRCDVGSGSATTPVCECGEGFTCTEILAQGGEGIRGSYCVRDEALM